MPKPKHILFGVLLLVGLVAFFFWQQRTLQRLQLENAGLREKTIELETLREEDARLAKTQIDPAELERLRKDRSELPRLRGEVSQLRRQLQEAQAAAAQRSLPAKEAPLSAAPAEQPLAPVETYMAVTRANVGTSQTLVTGGWTTPGGKRALFFIQPAVMDGAADQPGQVMLQTRIIELPDAVLIQLGLDGLKSENKQSSSQTVLTAEQTAAVLKTLENAPGVDLLSAPKITTLDGRQAQVKVGEVKTIAGEKYETGPTVDIVPQISPDRSSVDLSVTAQLRLQSPSAR